MSNSKDYENDEVLAQYQNENNNHQPKSYYNLLENSPVSGQIIKSSTSSSTLSSSTSTLTAQQPQKSTGAIKKIPEKIDLKRDDKINNNNGNHADDHLVNYRSSGPYIPLSDCFSGSPVLFVSFENYYLFKNALKTFFSLRKMKETQKHLSIR